jgi:choline dehydrogenase
LFEGRRAAGVLYAQQGRGSMTGQVNARREILLCAGAINTPKLLQISGIGSPKLLARLDVPMVHALPAVGENLQDHYMTHFIVRVNQKTLNGRGLALVGEATKWMLGRPSILAGSPSLVCGFANARDFSGTPDIQLDLALGNYTNLSGDRFPNIKLGFYQLRPKSTGFVRAVSADPNRSPIVQPNYLAHEEDQRIAIDGSKAVRRLLAAPALAPYYCAEEQPGPSVKDDADYLQFAREEGLTSYHVCGTCRMGPYTDPSSVVDDELRVHGLEGLRIADASIMPSVPSANTSAAVFMIAEKASDLILQHQTPAIMASGEPRQVRRQLDSASAV